MVWRVRAGRRARASMLYRAFISAHTARLVMAASEAAKPMLVPEMAPEPAI